MLTAFLSAITPVFLLAALGFFLARKTDYLEHSGLAMLSSQIALPALVFTSVTQMKVPVIEMGYLMGVTALCLSIGATLVAVLCKLLNTSPRFYLSTLVNPNTGNLGIPLVFALLGPEALASAVIISTTVTLSHWTLGTTAMSGRYDWRSLITNMPLLALLSGALVVSLELAIPTPITRTLDSISGIAIPIMVMLLGRSLARLKIDNARQVGIIAGLSIYRPVSGFLIAWLVVSLVAVETTAALSLLIQMSMPVAVMSYVLTVRYSGPVDRIAALTITSIPISLIILVIIFNFQSALL
jgi:predicted permease